MSSILIDFKSLQQGPEILLEKSIKVPDQRLLGIVPKSVNARFARLAIEDIDVPSAIKIRNKGKFIQIKLSSYDSAEKEKKKQREEILDQEHENFLVQDKVIPFQVVLNPQEIVDYNDFDTNDQFVRFQVVAQGTAGGKVETIDHEVRLVFNKAQSEARIEFVPEAAFRGAFEYRKEVRKVGTLKVWSQSDYLYSDVANCMLRVSLSKRYEEDAVYFGNLSEIKESNPHQAFRGGLIAQGETMGSDVRKTLAENKRELELRNILPNNTLQIPVYADLRRIEAPMQAASYPMNMTVWESGIEGDTLSFDLFLTPDTRSTALSVLLKKDTGPSFRLAHEKPEYLDHKYQWKGSDSKGSATLFSVEIGNNAQTGEGQIQVKDLHFSIDYQYGDAPEIQPTEGKKRLSDIFLVNGTPLSKFTVSEKTFKNGDAPLNFEFSFRHDAIRGIPEDIAHLMLRVRLRYCTHEESVFQPFSTDLIFRLERNLGPFWLAVDFGTSAVVAAFHDGGMGQIKLLNLQDILKELITTGMYMPEQIEEYGSAFLSSTMILQRQGIIHADNFREDLIRLSPYRREFLREFKFMVPYLKSLIGTEHLPNVRRRLDNFSYKEFSSDNKYRIIVDNNGLLKIETILVNAYGSLLRDFITPAIAKNQQQELLNKVIFTIPNTFTPRHTDYIRRLVANRFKQYFKQDYIAFLSESDAVACYYLNNWKNLNVGRDRKEQEKFHQGTEYVLVYDMGAGTLDITYLRIETIRRDNKNITNVEIIGRLGKTTAGNYFDYAIAEAAHAQAVSKGEERKFRKGALTAATSDAEFQAISTAMKERIRGEIKPKLSDDTNAISVTLKEEDGPLELYTDEINRHESVTAYVQKNTVELLDNFFELYRRFDGQPHAKGQFPLDTVIFSGRGSQYRPLREALKAALHEWVIEDRIYYVENLDPSKLKSVVVEGALQYATTYRDNPRMKFVNPNLQARYGILYKASAKGDWKFKELLNPGVRPLHSEAAVRDGISIHQYDTNQYDADKGNDGQPNTLDLSYTAIGYFVQSYALDTASDWANLNTEYITTMFEFRTKEVCDPRYADAVLVRVTIDEQNEMIVKIGDFTNDPLSPLSLDVSESSTFRKSMWPYMD